jgi:parvulin-like peptidyl-prolyl isomerase
MSSKPIQFLLTIFVMTALLFSGGCRAGTQVNTPAAGSPLGSTLSAGTTLTPPPVATTVVPTPTATPEPLALRINGEGISEAEYQAELRQLQEAQQTLGKTQSPEQQRQQVLDNLANTLLLAQGASEQGFQLDDAALQAEVDRLVQQLGGAGALLEWINQRGYTEANFRAGLRRQLAAAWQRDQIAAAVPAEAEQIHARQILTIEEDNANQALQQVKIPGTNFTAYAYRYDLQTGGDLGWFPRGYLTQAEVEEAAFALQPGEISPVVKSAVGYHIIQVIAREPTRAISPDARRVLQHKALQSWLKTRREAAKIEILLP